MSGLHLRGGRVVDPAAGVDDDADVIVADGRIAAVGRGLTTPAGTDVRVIDARGWLVVPGLIDLHAHLREPGQEYKEDVASGAAAAAAGGFTAVCAMPNTVPPNDTRAVTDLILERARAAGAARVYPVGAITVGLKGEALTEMGELKDAGVVAVSDDGRPVMNARLMRRALEYGRTFGLTVVQHAEDLDLSAGGVMNEGPVSTRAGLRGAPSQAEEVMVARDLRLVELTGARYHVAHVSTAGTVALLREAKRRGLPVTAEASPHHLTLTDEACLSYDTATKVNPPLRAAADVEALRAALADGTIDAVATDHAPHTGLEKDVEYDLAAFGMIGLETAVPLVWALVRAGGLAQAAAVERLTRGPARCFGLTGGTLAPGTAADVTCLDPERRWTCRPEALRSKSRNTPFAGWELQGKAVLTVVGGRVVYADAGAAGTAGAAGAPGAAGARGAAS
ncbi:MAG TPA: dihydroorotase [Myxococcota bacterium]|nr:dihydroorotase [Myxococcota bacterium]